MDESIKKNKEALENDEDVIYQVSKTTKQIPTQENNDKFREVSRSLHKEFECYS